MIIEAKDEITEAVNALMSLSAQYERGQCIPWGEIENIVGLRDNDRAKYVIKKWRTRLEIEREILTHRAFGVGVRLLTHREAATELPQYHQTIVRRRIRRLKRQLKAVDSSRLPDNERRLLAVTNINLATTSKMLTRSLKGIPLQKPTEGNPRRRVST